MKKDFRANAVFYVFKKCKANIVYAYASLPHLYLRCLLYQHSRLAAGDIAKRTLTVVNEVVEISRLIVDEEMTGEGVADTELGVYCFDDTELAVTEMLNKTAAIGQPAHAKELPLVKIVGIYLAAKT